MVQTTVNISTIISSIRLVSAMGLDGSARPLLITLLLASLLRPVPAPRVFGVGLPGSGTLALQQALQSAQLSAPLCNVGLAAHMDRDDAHFAQLVQGWKIDDMT